MISAGPRPELDRNAKTLGELPVGRLPDHLVGVCDVRAGTASLRFRLQFLYERPSGRYEPVPRFCSAITIDPRIYIVAGP